MGVSPGQKKSGRNNEVVVRRGSTVLPFIFSDYSVVSPCSVSNYLLLFCFCFFDSANCHLFELFNGVRFKTAGLYNHCLGANLSLKIIVCFSAQSRTK